MQEQREEIRLLEEKLKGLCCAHGNALMQIHDKDKEITRLRERERKLDALEWAGVDNWEGYGEAIIMVKGEPT